MPLRKRFEKELLPEWRTHCIDYKGLKRQAESLVGAECGAGAHASFLSKLGCEMDKASQLYLTQERRLCKFFLTLSLKFDEACKKHDARGGGGEPRSSPQEFLETEAVRKFVSALLALLVHIDSIRTFALLNILGVLKIARSHCDADACAHALQRLRTEPFYACLRLTSLVDEVSALCDQTLHEVFLGRGGGSGFSPDGPAQAETDEDRGAKHLTREELVAYCTWRNMKGLVPPWVCQSMTTSEGAAPRGVCGGGGVEEEGGDGECRGAMLLNGDWRSVRIKPQLNGFMSRLAAHLKGAGMDGFLPTLLEGMRSPPPKPRSPAPDGPQAGAAGQRPQDNLGGQQRGQQRPPVWGGGAGSQIRRVRTCSDLGILDMCACPRLPHQGGGGGGHRPRSNPASRQGSRWGSLELLEGGGGGAGGSPVLPRRSPAWSPATGRPAGAGAAHWAGVDPHGHPPWVGGAAVGGPRGGCFPALLRSPVNGAYSPPPAPGGCGAAGAGFMAPAGASPDVQQAGAAGACPEGLSPASPLYKFGVSPASTGGGGSALACDISPTALQYLGVGGGVETLTLSGVMAKVFQERSSMQPHGGTFAPGDLDWSKVPSGPAHSRFHV